MPRGLQTEFFNGFLPLGISPNGPTPQACSPHKTGGMEDPARPEDGLLPLEEDALPLGAPVLQALDPELEMFFAARPMAQELARIDPTRIRPLASAFRAPCVRVDMQGVRPDDESDQGNDKTDDPDEAGRADSTVDPVGTGSRGGEASDDRGSTDALVLAETPPLPTRAEQEHCRAIVEREERSRLPLAEVPPLDQRFWPPGQHIGAFHGCEVAP